MTHNPMQIIHQQFKADQLDQLFFATVSSVDGVEIGIIRAGERQPDDRTYPAADGLAAIVTTGDLVLVVRGRTGYGVVCKVASNPGTNPPEITGTRIGPAALADLLSTLELRGLIQDSSTATAPTVSGNRAAVASLADLLQELETLGIINDTTTHTPTAVTGSRGGNAALANLLTALDGLGVIDDQTTA